MQAARWRLNYKSIMSALIASWGFRINSLPALFTVAGISLVLLFFSVLQRQFSLLYFICAFMQLHFFSLLKNFYQVMLH